jgi:hypothetical protein
MIPFSANGTMKGRVFRKKGEFVSASRRIKGYPAKTPTIGNKHFIAIESSGLVEEDNVRNRDLAESFTKEPGDQFLICM